MSNPGAFLIQENFIDAASAQLILDKIKRTDWNLTHSEGLYANEKWRVIKLIQNGKPTVTLEEFPEVKQLITFFKCNIRSLVLFSLLPGGTLHRHRDVDGTLELGQIRLHIPLITHPDITFHCAGEDFHMKKGDLWAVNTSYKHAVNNPTQGVDRIHLMLIVDVNDWIWSLLPKKNFKYYLHALYFFLFIGVVALKTIFEPHKFKTRIALVPRIWQDLSDRKNKSGK